MTQIPSRKLSLKSFLSLQFLLVSLIPIALVLVLAVTFLFPHLAKQEALEQEALATAITSRVEAQFESAKRELRRFSEFLPFLDNETELQQLLDNVANINAVYEAVYITDNQGIVTHIGLPKLYQPLRGNYIGLDMSHKRFFVEGSRTKQDQFYGTFLSAVTGHLSAGYFIPLDNQMLIAEITVNQLPELSKFISQESGQTVMVLDREGQLLVHPDASFEQQQLNLRNLPIVQQSMEQGKASGEFSFQGCLFFEG